MHLRDNAAAYFDQIDGFEELVNKVLNRQLRECEEDSETVERVPIPPEMSR